MGSKVEKVERHLGCVNSFRISYSERGNTVYGVTAARLRLSLAIPSSTFRRFHTGLYAYTHRIPCHGATLSFYLTTTAVVWRRN